METSRCPRATYGSMYGSPLVEDRAPNQLPPVRRQRMPGEVEEQRRLDGRHVWSEGVVSPCRVGEPVGEALRPVLRVRHGHRVAGGLAQIARIAGQEPLDGKRHAVVRHVDKLVRVAAEPVRRVQPVLAQGSLRIQPGLHGGTVCVLRHRRGVGRRRTDLPQPLQVVRIQQQTQSGLAGGERPRGDHPGKGIRRRLPRRRVAPHQQPAEPRVALPVGDRAQRDAHPFQPIAGERSVVLVLAVAAGPILHHGVLASVHGCIQTDASVGIQPDRQAQPRVTPDRQLVRAGQLDAAGPRPAQLVAVAMVAAPIRAVRAVRPVRGRRPAPVGGEGLVPVRLDHRLAAIHRHRGGRPAVTRCVHGHSNPMEPSPCTMIGRSYGRGGNSAAASSSSSMPMPGASGSSRKPSRITGSGPRRLRATSS